jgi:parallel beta-helix repeat protein
VLGGTADNNLIQGNTVEGTIGPSNTGPAGQGIIVNGATEDDLAMLISGTRILGNIVRGNASGGIANINNTRARIERNVVEGNGLTNQAGNGIGVQMGARGVGIASQVLVQDNEVHGNGLDGIQINSEQNRIINNDAADNAVLRGTLLASYFPRGAYDLRDRNRAPDPPVPGGGGRQFDCDENVWLGNTWGNGYYFSQCVTTGGTGPVRPMEPEGPFFRDTCYDGIDNDWDGLTDEQDTENCEWPVRPESEQASAAAEADVELPPSRRAAPSLL